MIKKIMAVTLLFAAANTYAAESEVDSTLSSFDIYLKYGCGAEIPLACPVPEEKELVCKLDSTFQWCLVSYAGEEWRPPLKIVTVREFLLTVD